MRFAKHILDTHARYDDAIRSLTGPELVQWIMAAAPSSYALGNGGVMAFYPIQPGELAQVHLSIWDPMYMRRPELLRSVALHAMQRWQLRRLTAYIPTANRLGARIATLSGMTHEGTLRSAVVYTKNGTVHHGDAAVFGMLEGDF